MPVILATQEGEIRKIAVQSQPGQIVHETLSQKNLHKNRAGGVAQGEGLEFKPQYHKKNKKTTKNQKGNLSHVQLCGPIVSASWETEAGELYAPRSSRPVWAT
jgi:hypothetical protein